jgi:hypothetical protein
MIQRCAKKNCFRWWTSEAVLIHQGPTRSPWIISFHKAVLPFCIRIWWPRQMSLQLGSRFQERDDWYRIQRRTKVHNRQPEISRTIEVRDARKSAVLIRRWQCSLGQYKKVFNRKSTRELSQLSQVRKRSISLPDTILPPLWSHQLMLLRSNWAGNMLQVARCQGRRSCLPGVSLWFLVEKKEEEDLTTKQLLSIRLHLNWLLKLLRTTFYQCLSPKENMSWKVINRKVWVSKWTPVQARSILS